MIRRVFSLVDLITNTKFSNCPIFFFKLVWFGSKICIVSIKNIPEQFIIHKAVKTCAFYSQPSFYVFILGAV